MPDERNESPTNKNYKSETAQEPASHALSKSVADRMLSEVGADRPLEVDAAKVEVTAQKSNFDATKISGKNIVWQPTEKAAKAHEWLVTVVDELSAGNFLDAYGRAKHAPVETLNVEFKVHDAVLKASDIYSPSHQLDKEQIVEAHCKWIGEVASAGQSNFLDLSWIQNKGLSKEFVVSEGRTIITLDSGKKVDIMKPLQTLDGKPLTSTNDIEQMKALLSSAEGQKIQEKHAMTMTEEMVHVRQMDNNYLILSRTFAKTIENVAKNGSVKESAALLETGALPNNRDNTGYRPHETVEMEVPALLYDAGMPLASLKKHYCNHPSRELIFQDLEHQDLEHQCMQHQTSAQLQGDSSKAIDSSTTGSTVTTGSKTDVSLSKIQQTSLSRFIARG